MFKQRLDLTPKTGIPGLMSFAIPTPKHEAVALAVLDETTMPLPRPSTCRGS